MIRDKIHGRAFCEITSIPFPCLLQRFCDAARVLVFPDIDHKVKATRTTNIGLIYYNTNPIILYKAHLLHIQEQPSLKGLLVLDEQVDRLIVGGDIDTNSQRVEPSSTAGSEGDTGNLTLPFTSIVSPQLLVSGMVKVS